MPEEVKTNGNGDRAQNVMVFRGWGKDEPGIAEAFMQVVATHSCEVLDIAQFVLDGSLMFTFVLQTGSHSSALMQELSACASQRNLQLDFYFPESKEGAEVGRRGENVAIVSVVSQTDITPALLSSLDATLAEHGCIVEEIEQRSDNRREVNGEYNKVEIRVGCPKRLKMSTVLIGPPKEGSKGLQKVAWDHGAEVSMRWWNAMNRPNGKSLVVFGISEELCPQKVMEEVLKEAGVDLSLVPADKNKADGQWANLLKGKSADVIDKVIKRLTFTPGASLVCSALKRMGFRMAILSSVPVRKIAEHLQREFGMDYCLTRDLEIVDGKFTGNYTGEASEIRFRKTDLLKLMAERDGIDYRNVITIGKEEDFNAQNARDLVETFGPVVHFHAAKLKQMTIALYLLGFNGSDIRALQKRSLEDTKDVEEPAGKRLRVNLSTKSREAGQIRSVLAPIGKDAKLASVSQCSLQDGGMCLGLDLRLQEDPEPLLKDILLACQKHGIQALNTSTDEKASSSTAQACSDLQRRYVVTVVQKPTISVTNLRSVFAQLRKDGVNIARIERLSAHTLAALQLTCNLPASVEEPKFKAELVELSKSLGVDIAFQRDDVDRWMRRMVVFDMDSTLIQQEVIDELARYAGVEDDVKRITEAAMRGELNFFESLKSRVALLKGHNAEELFSKVKKNLIFTPGAKKLCTTLRKLGFKMAVISGGFMPVAREVQRHLGLDYAFANVMDVDETTGLLTGVTTGPVVTPMRKKALLATIADVEGCELRQTIAVGDGANDIPMLHTAGLGIAFCAKPKVQEVSEYRINQQDLSTVLFLLGVSEHAAERLAEGTN